MKRRKFLLTSGTALLGSTAITSVNQRPVLGLNFDLVGTESVQPSTVDSILIDFQNFEIVPKYVDEGDATVTITLNVEGFEPIKNQTTISFQNGVTKDKSDLGSAIPMVLDGVDTSQNALDGTITIDIEHPSISDSYNQSFTITDDPLQQGLVGWWPLHEWSGRANDLSQNNNAGTLNGNVTQGVSGKSSITAYSFDGDNDGIEGTINYNSNSYTMSCWVYPKQVPPSKKEIPLNFHNSTTDSTRFTLSTNGNWKHFHWPDSDRGAVVEQDLGSANLNEWQHIAATYDGSDIRVYFNGSFVSSETANSYYTPTEFSIGEWEYRPDSNVFTGLISDCRKYNKRLSDSEVQDLYELGVNNYTRQSLHDDTDSSTISRWKFNGDLNDSWGTNNGSNNTGTGYSSDSITGKSKTFNGSGEVDIGNIDLSDSYTIAGWTRRDDPGTYDVLLSDFDGSNRTAYISIDQNDSVQSVFSVNETNYVSQGGTVPQGWVHVAYTWNGTKQRSFLNGVLVSENTPNESPPVISSNFYIGKDGPSGSGTHTGQIDELRIYKKALSQTEIQQLYQWGTRGKDLREQTTTKNKSDMIGWWKLNETGGSTAYDSSGNDNDGIISGAEQGGASSPLGQSAYKFDGTSYVDVGKPGTFESMTISLWAKWTNSSSLVSPFGYYDAGNSENVSIFFNAQKSGGITFAFDDGNSRNAVTSESSSFADDNWHHIVGTLTRSGEVTVYVDSIMENKVSDADPNLGNADQSLSYYIGALNRDGSATDNLNGSIDDVRVYDRVLTPQEVSYLYEQKF